MIHNPDSWLLIAAIVPLLVVGLILTPLGRDVRRAAVLTIIGNTVSLVLALWTVARRLLFHGHMNHMGRLTSGKPMLWNFLPPHLFAPHAHHLIAAGAGRPPVGGLCLGMAVDSLTLVIFLLTTVIALLSAIYAIGLVDDRRLRPGWFAWASFFVFSVYTLIVAPSVLQMCVAGMLATVGLWGLAGAAWRGTYESAVRRVVPLLILGDALFLAGICLLLVHCGAAVLLLPQVNGITPIISGLGRSLHLQNVVQVLQADGASHFMGLGWRDWAGILMVFGISGKSAQFPLHTWAVETTPAATPTGSLAAALMIAITGPYMASRLLPLLNVDVRLLAAMAAACTLCVGSLCSLASTDVKRCLMWLVIAQAGLALLFIVTGSYVPGLYEAIYLALAAASLFFSGGTALFCTAGQFDMRFLGGLWKTLPVTAAASLLVSSSAMGLLLFGRPDLLATGFDNLRHYGSQIGQYGNLLFWLPLVACYLVLFGLARWWWLIFGGNWRGAGPAPGGESAVRLFPMILLGLGALVCGQPLLGLARLLQKSAPLQLCPPYPVSSGGDFAVQMAHRLAWSFPAALAAAGAIYFSGLVRAEKIRRLPGPNLIYRWMDGELYFYDLYCVLGRLVLSGGGKMLAAFDRWIIGWFVVSAGLAVRLVSMLLAALDWQLTSVAAPATLVSAAVAGKRPVSAPARRLFVLAILVMIAAALAGAVTLALRR